MANHKSTKKRIEVTARQSLENKRVRSALKTKMKKFDIALEEKDKNIEQILRDTISAVDNAASKGVIHKNAANRKKSRVAKKVAKA